MEAGITTVSGEQAQKSLDAAFPPDIYRVMRVDLDGGAVAIWETESLYLAEQAMYVGAIGCPDPIRGFRVVDSAGTVRCAAPWHGKG